MTNNLIIPIKSFMFACSLFLLISCGGGGGGGGVAPTNNTGGGTTATQYSVSVSVTGLTGTGLQLALASGITFETLNIASNSTYTFATSIDSGATYGVAIQTQATGQLCEVTGNTGFINSNVTITVNCVDEQMIGGTVSGLSGSVSLQLNGTNTLTTSANGSFTFTTLLATGKNYAVTVSTQPTGQTCLVGNSGGTVGSTSISNITVTCSTSVAGFLVGGKVSGFSGLIVLSLNGLEELSRTYNGNFTFSSSLPTSTLYNVTVLQQPLDHVCVVSNGTGTIADADFPFVDVSCTESYPDTAIGIDPDGASLSGSETMTLSLNAAEDITISVWSFNNAFFKTRLTTGTPYSVTVKTPPPGQVCNLYNNNGVITSGVTPIITLQCVSNTATLHTIGGSVTGLTGTGLELNLDGAETLAIAAAAPSYVFASSLYKNTSHTISIKTQPAGQICTLTTDWIYVSNNIVDLNVICSSGPHSIGGYATGVKNTGLAVSLNDSEVLPVAADGSFVFNTLFSDAMKYKVTISSHPTDQFCSLTRADGFNITANVNDIVITCVDTTFNVKVNVAGYSSSTPLLLQLNADTILPIDSNTSPIGFSAPFIFANSLKDTLSYEVTIAGQPEGQICNLTNASGTISGADVTNVAAYCQDIPVSAGPYTVSVTTSGLVGTGLTLQLNAANDLTVSTNGSSVFSTLLADAANFTVSVLDQPATPMQACQVYNGAGTIAGADFTQVYVVCANAVKPGYTNNGARWLDYVKNDGANTYTATDTACDPATDGPGYTACLNGGEFMQVLTPNLPDCTGVTAADNLNAFDWVCDNSSGVRIVSIGLKDNVYLSDLIDFTSGQFIPNYVSINDGVTTDVTQSSVWWDNPVRINNAGDTIKAGDITLVTGNVPSVYSMANNSALLVQAGFAIQPYAANASTVNAGSKNFLWLEGDINDVTPTAWGGVHFSTVNFSVLNNVQILNTGGTGLFMTGKNNKMRNIASLNNGGSGIEMRGQNYDLVNLSANNNLGNYGMQLSVTNSALTTLVANGNIRGIRFNYPTNLTVSDVTANDNVSYYTSYGIEIGDITSQGSGNTFSNITANNNQGYGIDIDYVTTSSYTNINAQGNGDDGFYLGTSTNSPIRNVNVSGNGGHGIYLFRWDLSLLDQVIATNNTGNGVYISQSDGAMVSNGTSNNNGGDGFYLGSANAINVNLTATNNGNNGINENSGSIMISASAINNGFFGLLLSNNTHNSSLLSLNNSADGVITGGSSGISNLVSANNTGFGINIPSDFDYFTGLLEIGSNVAGDCDIDGFTTDPGLVQGGPNGNPDNSCVLAGTSDATLIAGIDASTSIVGKVTTDDTVNLDDNATPGTVLFQNISNWVAFEHSYRAWGKDGSAFSNADNQDACATIDETCRIWDWSAATADTGNASAAAVYDVVSIPTGDDVFVHTWNFNSASQADCDTNFPGSVWDGVSRCETTYLRHAYEIAGDAIGNDNYLCESGETCLYTPNIGSYQGHGALVDAGAIGTGTTLENISLKKYEFFGR